MRTLVALILIMLSLIPLIIPVFLPCVHHHYCPLSTILMCPLISKICDSHVELGYEDNMFNMLGGNVDNCLSLGYLSGYDASLNPYCIYLEDKPKKIMWNTFFAFSFLIFLQFCFTKESTHFLCHDCFIAF